MKLKDWYPIENDVEATIQKVERLFSRWYKRNLTVTHGSGRTVEDIFGLPYTSSSAWAGIWNCQGDAELKADPQWKFNGIAITDNLDVVVILDREDTGNFDSNEIIIGNLWREVA